MTTQPPWRRRRGRGRGIVVRPEPVGTNFKSLVDGLGVAPVEGCNCEALRDEMDCLGLPGCIRKAAGPAVWHGLAFTVDPRDPIPGLFDELCG